MKEKSKRQWSLVLILSSGLIALVLILVMHFDSAHNYDSLCLLLTPIGTLLAIVAIVQIVRHRMPRDRKLLAMAPNVLALLFWGWWICWSIFSCVAMRRPKEWSEAYDQIRTGMTVAEVQALMGALTPETERLEEVTRLDPLRRVDGAESILFYRGPNTWKHIIYFDREGRVVHMVRWWS